MLSELFEDPSYTKILSKILIDQYIVNIWDFMHIMQASLRFGNQYDFSMNSIKEKSFDYFNRCRKSMKFKTSTTLRILGIEGKYLSLMKGINTTQLANNAFL